MVLNLYQQFIKNPENFCVERFGFYSKEIEAQIRLPLDKKDSLNKNDKEIEKFIEKFNNKERYEISNNLLVEKREFFVRKYKTKYLSDVIESYFLNSAIPFLYLLTSSLFSLEFHEKLLFFFATIFSTLLENENHSASVRISNATLALLSLYFLEHQILLSSLFLGLNLLLTYRDSSVKERYNKLIDNEVRKSKKYLTTSIEKEYLLIDFDANPRAFCFKYFNKKDRKFVKELQAIREEKARHFFLTTIQELKQNEADNI